VRGLILGMDTATPSTAVAVWGPEGPALERRDDPAEGQRPAHGPRLLALVEAALEAADAGWEEIGWIAVGVGPGGFTGLRLGIATARALAQGRDLPLVGVSSLAALAAGAHDAAAGRTVLAAIDARRGEVFAAAWRDGEPVLEAMAIAPADLAARLGAGTLTAPLAVGDGAVRYAGELAMAGAVVPPQDAPEHRLSALQVCRLGAVAEPAERDALLPDYRREPDAKPPRLP
jgi:tRNA threonylcarbamoyladenosine biosynthesis protein TsaB